LPRGPRPHRTSTRCSTPREQGYRPMACEKVRPRRVRRDLRRTQSRTEERQSPSRSQTVPECDPCHESSVIRL
jgi:hypothetical protein